MELLDFRYPTSCRNVTIDGVENLGQISHFHHRSHSTIPQGILRQTITIYRYLHMHICIGVGFSLRRCTRFLLQNLMTVFSHHSLKLSVSTPQPQPINTAKMGVQDTKFNPLPRTLARVFYVTLGDGVHRSTQYESHSNHR